MRERPLDERSQDEPLLWSQLPLGDYFYHVTRLERLESIRLAGLTPPEVHKTGKNWNVSFYPKDRVTNRLFFFVKEADCLGDAIFDVETHHNVALRFRRGVIISGAILFKDPGYVQNQFIRAEPYSFSVADVSVPASVLEACQHAEWDAMRSEYRCRNWIPISEANSATLESRLGQ